MPGVPSLGNISLASPTAGTPNLATILGTLTGQWSDMQQQEQLKNLTAKDEAMSKVQAIAQHLLPQIHANPSDPKLMKTLEQLYKSVGLSAPEMNKPDKTTAATQDPGKPPQSATPTDTKTKEGDVLGQNVALNQGGQTIPGMDQPQSGKQLDESQLGAKKSVADMTPAEYSTIMSMEPGARSEYLRQHFMDATDQMMSLPAQLTQSDRNNLYNSLQKSIDLAVTKGPDALQAFVDLRRGEMIQAGMDPDAVMNDPKVLQPMAAQAAAQLEHLRDLGLKIREADIPKAQAEMYSARSLQELRAAQEKYMGAKTQNIAFQDRLDLSKLGIAQQNADSTAAKASAEVQRVADQNINEKAKVSQQYMSDLLKAKTATDATVTRATGIINSGLVQGQSPDPEVLKALDQAKATQTTLKQTLDQLRSPAWRQAAINKSLNQSSVSTRRMNPSTSPPVQGAVHGKNNGVSGWMYPDGSFHADS